MAGLVSKRIAGAAVAAMLAAVAGLARPAAAAETEVRAFLGAGDAAFRIGDYLAATRQWGEAVRLCRELPLPALEGEALARRAASEQALGHLKDAIADLGTALKLAEIGGSPDRIAAHAGALGNAYALAHRPDQGVPLLDRSLELARRHHLSAVQAATANNLGNLWAAIAGSQRPAPTPAATPPAAPPAAARSAAPARPARAVRGVDRRALDAIGSDLARMLSRGGEGVLAVEPAQATVRALAFYEEGATAARASGDRTLGATIDINLARLQARRGEVREALAALGRAWATLGPVPASGARGLGLLALGEVAGSLPAADPAQARTRLTLVYEPLRAAALQAEASGNTHVLAQAYGLLGGEYERERRWTEAARLTDRAVQAAQAGHHPDLLYRWEWQRGRLFAATGDRKQALAAYRRAVAVLQSFRQDIPVDYQEGRSSFRETLGPLFTALADLLLRESAVAGTPEEQQALLRETQQTIERLRVAELDDYFKDQCAANQQSAPVNIAAVSAHTAVIYPILLEDRLELLVDTGTALVRKTSPTPLAQLVREVRNLRARLEDADSADYRGFAEKVYDGVLRPVEPLLQAAGVTALVFVPDGVLRLVPLAALHDGRQFLLERYAVATVPGLTLVDVKAMTREDPAALVAGLSESAHGAPPLPGVEGEIGDIGAIVPATTLKNDAFQLGLFTETAEHNRFSIIHIASHGFFSGDPDKSFVLTYDDFLTMNRIEQIMKSQQGRNVSVDLLTLSACSTAQGDDRAALGLGGVAVKAGARSAMGSLWPVQDDATARMIPEFYRQLRNPALSKAEALRNAQLQLLHDPDFQHPAAWSPYLMIGNWL
jgi:CHAT domain-containing protein